MYPVNTTRARPWLLRHRRLARSARALRLAWARPSAHLAPRASLRRLKRSRASSGSVWQEACGAHAARAGIAARGRPSPRSALRASLGHPHLAPRSARRSGASNAAGPAVAAYGRKPAAHRRSQGRHRDARRKAPPRSALRASLGRPLRSSPRSARRSERTAPRALRARGAVRGALARRAGALRPRP